MNIVFNGKTLLLASEDTLEFCLSQQVCSDLGQAFAVAVNGVFVPRSQHANYHLQAGDTVDILMPAQGG